MHAVSAICPWATFLVYNNEHGSVTHASHDNGSGNVWRLKKALYGLKQAAREWHRVLAQLLRDLDFIRCHSDPALYVRMYGRCIICYNPESVGSQAPGPDVCTRRRRSDIPCQGGQYVLTVVSRHNVACEH